MPAYTPVECGEIISFSRCSKTPSLLEPLHATIDSTYSYPLTSVISSPSTSSGMAMMFFAKLYHPRDNLHSPGRLANIPQLCYSIQYLFLIGQRELGQVWAASQARLSKPGRLPLVTEGYFPWYHIPKSDAPADTPRGWACVRYLKSETSI